MNEYNSVLVEQAHHMYNKGVDRQQILDTLGIDEITLKRFLHNTEYWKHMGTVDHTVLKPVEHDNAPFRQERVVGLRRKHYRCKNPNHKSPIGWTSYPPYVMRSFKHHGLWYSTPRLILETKPACPDCQLRDYVEVVTSRRKKNEI